MFGVGDRDDRGAVADAAGPAGDLPYVEHSVAALDGVGVLGFGHAVIGAQNQVRHPHVQTAMQPRVATPDRVDPAECDRKAAEGLPGQVVVEFARIVAMQ